MRRVLRSGLWWAILALVVVALLWFVPQLQGEYFSPKVPAEDRPALVNEYRRTWAQIIGGFGLLLGLYFTWRRIEISQQELEATRDQQVTERFTRAIDQLGASDDDGKPRLEIRLGGIYALERIAVDSFSMENSPGRDYSTAMDVLTAYVRENTAQAPRPTNGSSEVASTANETTTEADEGAKQSDPLEPSRPTADIQAILDVLSRTQRRVPREYRTLLDLHEANLSGADLQRAHLKGANLQRAVFQRADLQEAYLEGANLQNADLQRAHLQNADLQRANLQGASLQRADLQEADLRRTDLYEANLKGANLQRAFFQGADLRRTDLQGADLQRANLQEAYLTEANLYEANLYEANLKGASLKGADPHMAKLFPESHLKGASLQKAILQGASLLEAKVTDEQLADALSLEGATMPNGQTYEDWLKDKEGRGKDVENE